MAPMLGGLGLSGERGGKGAGPTVAVLGVPSSLGVPGAGPEAGPAALRVAGVLDRLHAARVPALDWGDVAVPTPDVATGGVLRNQAALAALTSAVAERVG